MKIKLTPILLASFWITISEFIRNEWILNRYWTSHYQKLGLLFETKTSNGILWALWSLIYAIIIFQIHTRISFNKTVLISWIFAFPMMWITLFNLRVLPVEILAIAIPLSILEVVIATLIIKRFNSR